MRIAIAPPSVLDIEASGFGRCSYPIEIGYITAQGHAGCMLVRPPAGWTHWDLDAERVHGITREILRSHGRPPLEVAVALNCALAGQTVYCDGWAHDYSWLAALFEVAERSPSFRLESINALLDESALSHLDGARRAALAELGLRRHRASNDARVLQRAVVRVAELSAQ
jgi:hypothetical protein